MSKSRPAAAPMPEDDARQPATSIAQERALSTAPAEDAGRQLAATPVLGFLQTAIATFEGIDRLAKLMAVMGTMPAHLQGKPADCFRIVVQAAKWGMDPFAVAESTALVKGKLCYEGKLVAAVLRATGAIEGRLSYEITGRGRDASIVVSGRPRGGDVCVLRGSVKDWETTHDGSPWAKQPETMLVYRGTRQWARLYAPEAILGVLTPDEAEEIKDATVVGGSPGVHINAPPAPPAAPPAPPTLDEQITAEYATLQTNTGKDVASKVWKHFGNKEQKQERLDAMRAANVAIATIRAAHGPNAPRLLVDITVERDDPADVVGILADLASVAAKAQPTAGGAPAAADGATPPY